MRFDEALKMMKNGIPMILVSRKVSTAKHLYGKTGRAGSIPASGIYERLEGEEKC